MSKVLTGSTCFWSTRAMPRRLKQAVKEQAMRDGVTMEQFVNRALAAYLAYRAGVLDGDWDMETQ